MHRQSAEGKKGDFYLLDAPDWVTILPFSGSAQELRAGAGSFIMAEQLRQSPLDFPSAVWFRSIHYFIV